MNLDFSNWSVGSLIVQRSCKLRRVGVSPDDRQFSQSDVNAFWDNFSLFSKGRNGYKNDGHIEGIH